MELIRGCICFLFPNRRVLFVKEVEILGHMSVDWQCLFEDFVCPPEVSENLLKISVKVRKYESDLQSQGLRQCFLAASSQLQRQTVWRSNAITVCVRAC